MESLIGMKFNRLTVISFVEFSKSGHCSVWECRCYCGALVKVRSGNLKTGHTKSCGCFQEETRGLQSLKHGHTKKTGNSRTYNIWASMKARCHNPHHDKYKYYGACGISVCGRWKIFNNFLSDMGIVPDGMEIDRINNDLGYFKENCRWSTKLDNMRNKKSAIWKYEGKLRTISEIAEMVNVPYHALRRRLTVWGFSLLDAIESCKNLRKVGVNKRNEKKIGLYSKQPNSISVKKTIFKITRA